MKNTFNVNDWVQMFREIGLKEEQMMQWHRLFEARHPDVHQSFLEWLNLPGNEVERIRSKSR